MAFAFGIGYLVRLSFLLFEVVARPWPAASIHKTPLLLLHAASLSRTCTHTRSPFLLSVSLAVSLSTARPPALPPAARRSL